MATEWQGSHWIRPEKRLALYMRDSFQCAYCGRDLRLASPEEVTLDHLVPRVAGGKNDSQNLVTACGQCNSSRGAKPWTDYATGGARDRIQTLRFSPINLPLAKAILAGTAGDPRIEALR